MFAATAYGRAGVRAGARYRNVDVVSRVESASSHGLVGILFEELLTSLSATRAALAQADHGKRAESQSRALAILTALDTSLDHEKGGEIAAMLALVYRECRRLLMLGVRTADATPIDEARKQIGEIATAWNAIA